MKLLALVPRGQAAAVGKAARPQGADVERAASVDALFDALSTGSRDLTLVSLTVDHVDEPVLERIAGTRAAGSLLLSAPRASLGDALMAERIGAVALLREPLDPEVLRRHVQALADHGPVVSLPDVDDGEPTRLVGESAPMADVFGMIAKVARSSSTVLVTGESGTGKEIVARTLHDESERRGRSFVAVNCAAIPEALLESELFGHERGAFTGAVAKRAGRFQRADGGTLFLDEIGDMSLALQAKLLRALEERRVERVGSETTELVDVRVIAATNRRLQDAIAEGGFREDLYYRLAVVEIELPPLRARGDDVRRLALHFAARFARRHGRPVTAISVAALARIQEAEWPGNVRELRNVMERAVLLSGGPTIGSGSLRLGAAAPRASSKPEPSGAGGYPPTAALAAVEADHIRRVLASVSGQIGNAADILGIHRNTLSRKIQEYRLHEPPQADVGR